ncbi:MAG: hypothetical protein MK142_07950, partial [Pseudomonadales bacterium]|nr:hypothetical protein [Pseudomonadales bacterium]
WLSTSNVLVNLEHLSTFEKRSHLSVIEEARLWLETEGEGASGSVGGEDGTCHAASDSSGLD